MSCCPCCRCTPDKPLIAQPLHNQVPPSRSTPSQPDIKGLPADCERWQPLEGSQEETAGWGFPLPLLSWIKQSQRRYKTRLGCATSSLFCPPLALPSHSHLPLILLFFFKLLSLKWLFYGCSISVTPAEWGRGQTFHGYSRLHVCRHQNLVSAGPFSYRRSSGSSPAAFGRQPSHSFIPSTYALPFSWKLLSRPSGLCHSFCLIGCPDPLSMALTSQSPHLNSILWQKKEAKTPTCLITLTVRRRDWH